MSDPLPALLLRKIHALFRGMPVHLLWCRRKPCLASKVAPRRAFWSCSCLQRDTNGCHGQSRITQKVDDLVRVPHLRRLLTITAKTAVAFGRSLLNFLTQSSVLEGGSFGSFMASDTRLSVAMTANKRIRVCRIVGPPPQPLDIIKNRTSTCLMCMDGAMVVRRGVRKKSR